MKRNRRADLLLLGVEVQQTSKALRRRAEQREVEETNPALGIRDGDGRVRRAEVDADVHGAG